jgi:hypothetical protein
MLTNSQVKWGGAKWGKNSPALARRLIGMAFLDSRAEL